MTLLDALACTSVRTLVPDRLLDAAAADVAAGRLTRPRIGERRATAWVPDGRRGRVRAELLLGPAGLVARCSCGARDGRCRHVAALALVLTGGAVPPPVEAGDAAPEEVERRRRVERGASGLFTIVAAPSRDGVHGRFAVQSPSERSYEVVIRSLAEPHNGCTCPDFGQNLLGTCKHIEAVLAHLRQHASRRTARAARAGNPAPYLHLAFPPGAATPEVRLRRCPGAGRPVLARFFDGAGALVRPLVEVWADLQTAAGEAEIEIPAEVVAVAERALAARARAARVAATEAEVRRAGPEQPGLRQRLYPYQVDGVAFLAARERALLADDMGLGKTAQAIAALARLVRTGEVRRALVVCPTSLKHQWARELEHFVARPPLRTVIVGGSREVRRAQYRQDADVLITSYELARLDERDLAELPLDLLVLDEAQRIKNWRTRTADVVKRLRTRFAFVLTGTPLENRLDDLYSLMQVVDPHLFGPLWRFNQDFTRLDERGRVQGYHRLDELRARIAPCFLRRRKEDVLDQLPERLDTRVLVPLTVPQRELHDDAEATVARLLAILKKRPLSPIEEQRLMRAFQRMRMACDAAQLVDAERAGAPKLDELATHLEEICLQGGHKVVVFSEWEKMQALAAEVCARLGLGHVRLHGGVPSATRGPLIDRFREDPACQVFLSTDAGGVGLNLQAASHVINLDLPWNPAVLAQRIARVHRLGQRNAVNVVLLIGAESFEQRLEATLGAKRALFAAAVGDDAETTEIERTSLAKRIATLLDATFAATTGRPEPPPAAPDEPAALAAALGPALARVLRTRDGRLVALVHDEAAAALPHDGALVLTRRAAEALAAFGAASPLADAEVVLEPPAPPDPAALRRRQLLDTAQSRLAAARTLVTAGQPTEALGQLREALVLGCRAHAAADPGEDAAALLAALYGELIPQAALTAADAHALTRAGELWRAFATAASPPPPALLAELERDAADLLARGRERLGAAPSGS
jgi:superfamily II DNA or RNA helicase